jgi:hypothetical protein
MPRELAAQFREKQQLVALFRAQLDLLRAALPAGVASLFGNVNVDIYDRLLAEGAAARWPKGILSGLRQGIRDAQIALDIGYRGPERMEVRRKLRAASGAAGEMLEERDSKQLLAVRRRGRIRDDDEYYVVVAAIDRLETCHGSDQALLLELRRLADSSGIS